MKATITIDRIVITIDDPTPQVLLALFDRAVFQRMALISDDFHYGLPTFAGEPQSPDFLTSAPPGGVESAEGNNETPQETLAKLFPVDAPQGEPNLEVLDTWFSNNPKPKSSRVKRPVEEKDKNQEVTRTDRAKLMAKIDWRKYSVRRARSFIGICQICEGKIESGEQYHDGSSRFAHIHCVPE